MMSQPEQPPASHSRQQGGEVSRCAGLPAAELHAESSLSIVSDGQKRESSRGQTPGKIKEEEKNSPEWQRCMEPAWRGQTVK